MRHLRMTCNVLAAATRAYHAPPTRRDRDFLYGRASVMNCLKGNTRVVHRLYVRDQSDVKPYLKFCMARRVQIKESSLNVLNKLSGDRPHQNVILEVSPFPMKEVKKLGFVMNDSKQWHIEGIVSKKDIFQIPLLNQQYQEDDRPQPIVVCLDQIVDPQNLGAILRSCYFFGIDAVVMTDRDTAPLSAIVSRASGGALELMSSIYSTSSLGSFLNQSKENGWFIAGTDLNGRNVTSIGSGFALDTGQPLILVMGNEGEGLRKGISEACDRHLVIPGFDYSSEPDVDSLNVSVATGILLHCIVSNRSQTQTKLRPV